ncbi:MAG: hypothetical protein PHI12_12165 [Dehalococcoidales bacterium]|nr:hypothetical protein [Dehalococcoidales bacterium]
MDNNLSFFILVVVYVIVREWISMRHREERRELYDRIMAGGLDEFQVTRETTPSPGRGFVREALEKHEKYVQKLRGEEE